MANGVLHRKREIDSRFILGVNSGAPEGWAFLAQLVTIVMLFLLHVVHV